MYISRLAWDNYRIEHVALHNVEPHEVKKFVMTPFIVPTVKDVLVTGFMDKVLLVAIYLWSLNISKVVCTNPLLHAI